MRLFPAKSFDDDRSPVLSHNDLKPLLKEHPQNSAAILKVGIVECLKFIVLVSWQN